jgi:hypothetical protein
MTGENEIYVKQLEADNERLRQRLAEAQETIDYYGASWTEGKIVGSEHQYSLQLGHMCIAVIISPFTAEYRCHVIRFDAGKWRWESMETQLTLECAKSHCESRLGFGKKLHEKHGYDKEISEQATGWMRQQMDVAYVDIPMTSIPAWVQGILGGK